MKNASSIDENTTDFSLETYPEYPDLRELLASHRILWDDFPPYASRVDCSLCTARAPCRANWRSSRVIRQSLSTIDKKRRYRSDWEKNLGEVAEWCSKEESYLCWLIVLHPLRATNFKKWYSDLSKINAHKDLRCLYWLYVRKYELSYILWKKVFNTRT